MELASQIFALVIFVGMFIAVVSDKWHRYIPALVGAGLTIIVVFLIILRSPQAITDTLNLGQLTHQAFWWVQPGEEPVESHQGVNWQTIIFIGGMMVMVEGLGEVGFFRWLCLRLAKLVNYRVVPILVSFMLLSGFLAMFIDSITVLLFLATVTIELARLLKFDPVPVIIAEIFASNVGGSATMCGDPPNIIIGTAYGYSFFDFATNTGPIAWIGMFATLAFFYFAFRKVLKASHENANIDPSTYPEPRDAIVNMNLFRINTFIFILIVVLRGLEVTGVLVILADFIAEISGGNIMIVIPIILWISAFASAIVDNIPFAATMIPVLRELAIKTAGFEQTTLAWTLALGTDIGGNATPIGASANVVGTAVAQREGYPISWGRFCKYTIPATIMVIGLCWLYLVIRYT